MELLAYFVNENTLMEAVENSLKNGLEGKEVEVRDKKQERKVEESMSGINLSSPVTPPNRIYAELPSPDYGASSKVDKESTDKRKEVEVVTRVSEDQVVETIEKFEADMN
ncbi:7360_t:CDS:2 [Rhizophagus irregularis]|nr:7360_t:CDS:2 [Rhizophagus irregularis]